MMWSHHQNLHFFVSQNWKKKGHYFLFCPKCPQSHLKVLVCQNCKKKMPPKNLTFWGVSNVAKSHLGISNDQNLLFLWAKNAKNKKKYFKNVFLSQKPPKVNWECPMAKLCIFPGPKMLKSKKKKSKKSKENCFVSNAPQTYLEVSIDQNLTFCGAPNFQKLAKKIFKNSNFVLFQMPPKVILGCPVTKICIYYSSKMPQTEKKIRKKNLQNVVLPKMPPKAIWGVSNDQNLYIFWGPNYLPHAATNTASLCFATHSCLRGRYF